MTTTVRKWHFTEREVLADNACNQKQYHPKNCQLILKRNQTQKIALLFTFLISTDTSFLLCRSD